MLMVTKEADDGKYQTYALPGSVSGTVYIRVSDSHYENRELVLGQVHVDHMFIRCESAAGPDTTPPAPDPMMWAEAPQATGSTSVSMTATTASDASGVEYYFACITDAAHDSGWQDNPTYDDTGLSAGTEYTYTVTARDKSPLQNETAASSAASATTDSPDTTPPSPDPMTWATVPYATGSTSISMTATMASDTSGVEYYFACNDPTHDSGWQDSPTYEDTGLTPDTEYTYQVQARDKSPNQNVTGFSSPASATTSSQQTQTVYVESISMGLIPAGKNSKGAADVQISVYQANATVVGDWYLGSTGTTADKLLESGATGLTDAGGLAAVVSIPVKAKSGEYFTFVVTDVILTGYVFNPVQGVTENSIIVP